MGNLASEAKKMAEAKADWLHVDVMDGHFVDNMSFGVPLVKALRKHTDMFLDCHLMVTTPEKWVDRFGEIGVEQFTFHIEATEKPAELIDSIKKAGMKVGIAISPATDVELLLPYGDEVDLFLVMTVVPGFGGQSFMESVMPKVKVLREKFPSINIQVDGGLSPKTVDIAAAAGANVIVAGSAVFKADDPSAVIKVLSESVQRNIE